MSPVIAATFLLPVQETSSGEVFELAMKAYSW